MPTAPAQAARTPRPVKYAGFWLRLYGYVIDSVVVYALGYVTIIVGGILVAIGAAVGGLVGGAVMFVVAIGGGLTAYYRLIPAQLSARGATVGMRFAGLELLRSDDAMYISRSKAVLRCVAALVLSALAAYLTRPLQHAFLEWIIDRGIVDGGDVDAEPFMATGSFGFVVIHTLLGWVGGGLPALVNLTNRRRQTIYDMVTSTVVVRRSSWKQMDPG